MKEKIKFLRYTLFHPFDGFYEIKYRGKGSIPLGIVIVALYCIAQCFNVQYQGFVINDYMISEMNSIQIIITTISMPILFMAGNWAITTLFDGKGSFKDIFSVISYALAPLLIADIFLTFISNFIIIEEAPILNAIYYFALVWFVFLVFSGFCVIHEYSPLKNIVTLLATAAAMAIVLFLFVLFLSLMEQMVSFFSTAGQEFIRRL